MESEWVKLCPYLGVTPPHPLVAQQDQTAKEVMDIYSFFKERNPTDPFQAFVKHYTALAKKPGMNESKLSQIKNSISLLKIVRESGLLRRRTEKQLRDMGVKLK